MGAERVPGLVGGGYHVVVEGILYADHYGEMLARLRADHRGSARPGQRRLQ